MLGMSPRASVRWRAPVPPADLQLPQENDVTGIPPKVRATVLARADGRCEGCGNTAPLELHHRRFRSRGGKHTVPNLVALCGWGNHTGCHGRAHNPGAPEGWAISGFEQRNDHLVPFLHARGRVWLTDDGRTIPADDEPNF